MAGAAAILDPSAIEAESFAIIDREVGAHGYDDRQWPVVRRIIHTTADFDFARTTCFSPGAVEAGIDALRQGASVLGDTHMVLAGVNKTRLAALGGDIRCHVADPDVAAQRPQGIVPKIPAIDQERAGCISH